MSATKVMKMMKDNEVVYVDLRFTDTIGKEHCSVMSRPLLFVATFLSR
jgi:glutamine synthetase